jgi:sarcosine oxidase subunit beta
MGLSASVVIIGGGIQGLSLAYHLAQRGLSNVCLIEMDMLGSGSSGQSASIIGRIFQSETLLPFTLLSFEMLMRFEAELGCSPGFEPIGCLILAGEGAAKVRQRYTLLQRLGVPCEIVGPQEVSRLTPDLNLEGIELAVYLPEDGGLDPHSIMMGYAGRAREMGVQIREGVRATGLQIDAGRISGVQTTAGVISTPCVVNAAGAYAAQVANWADLDLSITNYKRHIVVTGPVSTYSMSIPFTYEWGQAWYMRREGPGVLIGMGSQPTTPGDVAVDMDFVEQLIDYTTFRAPAMADAGLMTSWAGLRPFTADEEPVLGESAQLPGFINDCGWNGHGVMHAPAAGLALAELIVDGAASSVDITPFRLERFQS